MIPSLSIVRIVATETGFVAVPDDQSEADTPGRSFSVALVAGVLDARQSGRAFACDFLAVDTAASVLAVDRAMLRRRAGARMDDHLGKEGRLDGSALITLGLAAFTIDGHVDACARRILAMADTLSALKRARRYSCPGWRGSGAFPID